ncbi:hypothetical protein B0H65DRAFT_235438 [Neurospora tetraspora]|uniref:Uncharacterized protein n=1 Tax=Neurospora tetraspora TaxID=94610 RepID=A0AAE0MR14_9PEZI|nr:hypothetical protein B0H65DRAFT_235438 [Neurospora tetraspora]
MEMFERGLHFLMYLYTPATAMALPVANDVSFHHLRVAARKALAWPMRGPFFGRSLLEPSVARGPPRLLARQCQRRTPAPPAGQGVFRGTAGQERSTALPSACPAHPSGSSDDGFCEGPECCSSHMTRGTSSRFHFQVLPVPPVIQSWL